LDLKKGILIILLTALNNDVESHANLADEIKANEALIAADMSVAEGRPIRLSII